MEHSRVGLIALAEVAARDVLELGCGAAQWSIGLAHRGARPVGLDNSARQLEYDRGTERAREYAAKLEAYYRYRDSGASARYYLGFPTVLAVTTSEGAEDLIAHQAYLAAERRGGTALPVLLTTTGQIERHTDG